MNLLALLTASLNGYIPGMKGAALLNYTELASFIKNEEGRIVAATLRDRLTNQTFTVRAKYFVNATGSQSDSVRKLDNPETQARLVHLKAT
jgi:glycerol-3-phosphate dehydrogenase